ncbi:hypothetical protein SKAU_G00142050 [Synaphobranchus kaupii]|uniref:B30.2/SPRY domain-containing protein n=1 Tax=Synaphobranchus kaupii TaxID=118154 RepID=A0A9Q1J3F0_SYNKA|nr:hypothetical protein SKAU_G00142050 [Synaphobranchus kaupii]
MLSYMLPQDQKQKRMEDFVVEVPCGAASELSCAGLLKRKCLDRMLTELHQRFSCVNSEILKGIQACDPNSENFLCDTISERAQCTLQDPELLSGALIDVAKHLGNLKYRVWEKMLEMVQYSTEQKCPDNPERFKPCVNVLGSEGFTSGKHSWEVKVGNKTAWDVGVAKESITRKGKITIIPKRGFWVMMLRNGEDYRAGGGPKLTLERKPQSIRVQLDYAREEVSFFNSSDMSHIYTFTDTFTERVFPYFSPCLKKDGNDAPLQICPVKVSVTVMSSQ